MAALCQALATALALLHPALALQLPASQESSQLMALAAHPTIQAWLEDENTTLPGLEELGGEHVCARQEK